MGLENGTVIACKLSRSNELSIVNKTNFAQQGLGFSTAEMG